MIRKAYSPPRTASVSASQRKVTVDKRTASRLLRPPTAVQITGSVAAKNPCWTG